MKYITEKLNLPHKLTFNKVEVYNKPKISNTFNNFFINIGQKLISQIQNHVKHMKHLSIKLMS